MLEAQKAQLAQNYKHQPVTRQIEPIHAQKANETIHLIHLLTNLANTKFSYVAAIFVQL